VGASFGIHVNLKGAVVEGRAAAVVETMTHIALEDIADYAKFEIGMELINVLQHPTGYYESRITKERRGSGVISINDSGVIYGPWLEGVGSRNAPVTSFKGYATFRRMRNRVAQKAPAIADAAIARKMGAMG
jgi:hypothetical protein